MRHAGGMPDYGHPLRFGVFITPSYTPAQAVVDAAIHAENVGFDLVSFQDHPYQPSFYDTWTLLSYIAARTSTIELAGNVLNLPLRHPAVLARSAASLDLLTGGRVALGLGAGAFWDAIEALGGPRRTPGQAVDALIEAVEIIREIWDTATPGPVRVDGDHYRVYGAKRGPAPAHNVPIWLGAYRPRMLRTVGRIADGWLPSLSYLKDGDLRRGNDTIDAAATHAGRDPHEIVRLLNVGTNNSAAELTNLALADGVSTFIVAADDPATMDYFATEVIPQVREAVADGRSGSRTKTGAPLRSASHRAKRKPGINYDAVPPPLRARALEPADAGFGRYTAGYVRGGNPGLVLRPAASDEVSDAVRFASNNREVPLGIFSAGHGISGRSLNQGGIVIDVGALQNISVLDDEKGLVRIEPGARWVEVARALGPYQRALTSGDYGGVGVGGLATAGGIGFFARQYGLTIDHLTAVEIVLADGSQVRADATVEPDLFWAVRGAGANFGIVTAFEFHTPQVTTVAFAQLAFDATDTAVFLQRWSDAIISAPRTVSGEIIIGGTDARGRQFARAMLLINEPDEDRVIAALQPIAQIAPLVDQQIAMTTYPQIMDAFFRDTPQQSRGEPLSHSGLARELTPELATEIAALLHAGASYFLQIRSLGGATSDIAPEATAFGWRDANFSIAAMGTKRSRLDQWWPRLLPHMQGMYLNFETDTGPETLARAFPPTTLARLRELKRRYDPTGLFRDNFFIDPTVNHAE